jgi:hypothetical protein
MYTRYLTIVFSTFGVAYSHSWVEQLSIICNGEYIGEYGYSRGYVPRNAPDFIDQAMIQRIPRWGVGSISEDDNLCSINQQFAEQTPMYPRLRALSGDYVALRYLENGHVSKDRLNVQNPGMVYVYGTTQSIPNEKLVEVMKWSRDGSGGDQRGALLTKQSFDDGRCYEVNNSSLSLSRQSQYPNSGRSQWCETDIQLPPSLSNATTYTLYWVWEKQKSFLPNQQDEYYITCCDVDIVLPPIAVKHSTSLAQQDPQPCAVPDYRFRAAD